jgi:CheY-like chemotaxis protein
MASPFEKLRVIVVDDNMHMRALLRGLLQSLGIHDVVETSDGGQAFAIMRDFKPDIVLTDLSMQPVDGIEFTRMVRTRKDSPNPYIPIIMVTGHTERSRVEAARDAGVNEFIVKPITAKNLTARITTIVERPRPFVRGESYVGPDRRRRKDDDREGPWRRSDDKEGSRQ